MTSHQQTSPPQFGRWGKFIIPGLVFGPCFMVNAFIGPGVHPLKMFMAYLGAVMLGLALVAFYVDVRSTIGSTESENDQTTKPSDMTLQTTD